MPTSAPVQPAPTTFERDLPDKVDSGANALWINITGDEGRAERMIKLIISGAAKTLPREHQTPELLARYPGLENSAGNDTMDVLVWDVIHGAEWDKELTDPVKALQAVSGNGIDNDCVVIFKDLHTLLNHNNNYGLRRCLAELCKGNAFSNPRIIRPIAILSDTPAPHAAIKDYVSPIEFGLPDYQQIMREVVNWTQDSIRQSNDEHGADMANCSDDLKDQIANALLGLGAEEGQRILGFASTQCGGLKTSVMPVIAREKAEAIRKVEGLEFIPYSKIIDASEIGGYDAYYEWLYAKRRTYSAHARSLNQPRPRGVSLVGPPGTGKTEVGKLTAKVLGLDLIKMDIASLYDSLVGGTEKKTRQAFGMVRAMRRCVLLLDELDKVMGGAHQSQSSDSGVSSRMLSSILQFLSDRDMTSGDEMVFVMMTMNRVDGMPPELLRPGRIDRVYTTSLPGEDDLEQILKIHLAKHRLDPERYGKGLRTVVSAMKNYSGAEVAEVVNTARVDAYHACMTAWEGKGSRGNPPGFDDVTPTIEHLVGATTQMTPLASLMADDIEKMNTWCQRHGTPVSGRRVAESGGATQPAGRVRTSRSGSESN